MKNKKFTIGLTLLIAGALVFTNCKKESPQPAEPDMDFTSSEDFCLSNYIVQDINEICAQSGDGGSSLPFFNGSINRDTINKKVTVTFNNTLGNDAKVRNGVLVFSYANSTIGAKYYRQPGYKAVATSTSYVVDGYSVNINSMTIDNLTANGFVPAKDSLTWKQTCDVDVWKPSDADKITVKGWMNKILLNTNPALGTGTMVPYTSITTPIKWGYAQVGYHGELSGVTSDMNSYKADIWKSTMLKRYFGCAPDKLTHPERHPNIKGQIIFDVDPNNSNLTTKKEVRTIDYDPFKNEHCDYNTSITIKGISYSKDMN